MTANTVALLKKCLEGKHGEYLQGEILKTLLEVKIRAADKHLVEAHLLHQMRIGVSLH